MSLNVGKEFFSSFSRLSQFAWGKIWYKSGKTIFYSNEKIMERLSLKLNLKIEFWLPSNGSQLVAAWTPEWRQGSGQATCISSSF